MTLKRDHNTCTECGEQYHVDHPWKRNANDLHVCLNCAMDIPAIHVIKIEDEAFAGFGSLKCECVNTRQLPTREEARTDVLRMCRRMWGSADPVEENY